ncbi:(deoxy)nucleoside triphosphate pyrophosphohydrolase [bacterium]|nr:(deoxy)nucleoside triphosphate pyrophosphohydrolase [bacterium]
MKIVTCAVIFRNSSVLLARRRSGQSNEGYWEFPGGKIEDGETPQACLEREIFEELGIKCKAGRIIAESNYVYSTGTIRLIAMETEIFSDEFILSVHDRVQWISIDRLQEYLLTPADIPIAEIVQKMY